MTVKPRTVGARDALYRTAVDAAVAVATDPSESFMYIGEKLACFSHRQAMPWQHARAAMYTTLLAPVQMTALDCFMIWHSCVVCALTRRIHVSRVLPRAAFMCPMRPHAPFASADHTLKYMCRVRTVCALTGDASPTRFLSALAIDIEMPPEKAVHSVTTAVAAATRARLLEVRGLGFAYARSRTACSHTHR